MKSLRISASVLKILAGMVFIISALSKFVTIDSFEVYVYSFGLFPLSLCFLVARLVIVFELILGAALISHRHHRFTVVATLLFLICFVAFLTYAQLIGRTDSCHCFGDLLPFNPLQSILKNAVLILLLLFVYKYCDHQWSPSWWLTLLIYLLTIALVVVYMAFGVHAIHFYAIYLMLVMMAVGLLASFSFFNKWYVTASLVLAPLVAVFILTPPDNWFYKGEFEPFDKELFYKQLAYETDDQMSDTVSISSVGEGAERDVHSVSGTLSSLQLQSGRHLVAFFSPGCGFCRLAAGKISTIYNRHSIDPAKVIYIFPTVSDTLRYAEFYEASRSSRFVEQRIEKDMFVYITRGAFPLIALVDNGEVVASYSYRDIDESEITDFLTDEQ